MYVYIFDRFLIRYFKSHPHKWLTADELIKGTKRSFFSVELSLVVLSTLRIIEYRLSNVLIDKGNNLRKAEIARMKKDESLGVPNPLSLRYYEYKLRYDRGTKLPSFSPFFGRLNMST